MKYLRRSRDREGAFLSERSLTVAALKARVMLTGEKRMLQNRRLPLVLALGGMVFITGLGNWLWPFFSTPQEFPEEYKAIQLGMTNHQVNTIMFGGSFRLTGPGFSGWYKDQQYSKDAREWKNDSTKWPGRFYYLSWQNEIWSIGIIYDADNTVGGKSLILIDQSEFSFFRGFRRWIRRNLGL